MVGTIAMTVDYHANDIGIWIELQQRGFRGTFYAAPETINQPGGPTFDYLVLINQLGSEVGVYTNTNMVDMWTSNRDAAFTKLKSLYDDMEKAGFKVETLAPNGRMWNAYLANYTRTRYKGIRVANTGALIATYPILDRHNMNDGAYLPSLGTATPLAKIKEATDAVIAANGMIVIVVHKIGPVGDGYTLAKADWDAMLAYWSSKGSSLRVVPFREALYPPDFIQ